MLLLECIVTTLESHNKQQTYMGPTRDNIRLYSHYTNTPTSYVKHLLILDCIFTTLGPHPRHHRPICTTTIIPHPRTVELQGQKTMVLPCTILNSRVYLSPLCKSQVCPLDQWPLWPLTSLRSNWETE